MSSSYTEDHLVEQPAIALLRDDLGWTYANCDDEWATGKSTLGREAKREVVIAKRLQIALEKLNPDLSPRPSPERSTISPVTDPP